MSVPEPNMTFPEVSGKLISELSVYEDVEFGREILIRFSDGTQLSIAVGVRQVVDARFCNEDTPDLPISHKRAD
jgi:hypothetical protein